MTFPDIILIRHGQTEWNAEGRIQGQGDSVLSGLGHAQAAAYGRLLADRFRPLDRYALYRSPAGRCAHTAALAAKAAGLNPAAFTVDDRLIEKAYGAWEGLTRPEIALAGDESQLRAMDADPWRHRTPPSPTAKNETLEEVSRRAQAWLRALDPSRPVIAVSHGGTGRCLIGAYLGLGVDDILAIRMRQDVIFHLSANGLDILGTDVNSNLITYLPC
ncbi:MAG: histidine phosphatase family protein [Rhodospirillaceae bacterium]